MGKDFIQDLGKKNEEDACKRKNQYILKCCLRKIDRTDKDFSEVFSFSSFRGHRSGSGGQRTEGMGDKRILDYILDKRAAVANQGDSAHDNDKGDPSEGTWGLDLMLRRNEVFH